MDEDDPLDRPLPFQPPRGLVDAVCGGLGRAYDAVGERHEAELGFDGLTFGINVARVGWFQIELDVSLSPGLTSSRANNSFHVHDEDRRSYGVYRGGDTAAWDIWTFDFDSGTETRASGPTNNTRQLALEFDHVMQPDESEVLVAQYARDLTFVHAGNAADGMCALYLGAAVRDEKSGKSRWAWVRRVWSQPQISSIDLRDGATATFAAYDEIPEPELTVDPRPVSIDESAQSPSE
jgi:hypothetical protein